MKTTQKIMHMKLKTETGMRVTAQPGETIRVYGYNFLVLPDYQLVTQMPEEMAKNEIAAGRMEQVVVSDFGGNTVSAPVGVESSEDGLGYDVSDFYGTGSIEKLEEYMKSAKMPQWKLLKFAETRLQLVLSPTYSKTKIRKDILDAIRQLHAAYADAMKGAAA